MSIFGHKPGIIPPIKTTRIQIQIYPPVAPAFVSAYPNTQVATNADGFCVLDVQSVPFTLTIKADGYKPYSQVISQFYFKYVIGKWSGADGQSTWIQLPAMEREVTARTGLIVANGRNYQDKQGIYYPLGATLFWALNGYKNELDRLKSNLDFLRKYNFDYVRILGEVGWGSPYFIDPSWPEYDQILTGFIDLAYGQYGLRTGLTLIGGGTNTDYVSFVNRIPNILKGRESKIQWIEVANEAFQNLPDLGKLKQLGSILRAGLPSTLVSLSSPGFTTDELAEANDYSSVANLITVHLDRGNSDDGWRFVRQPWDWKDYPLPIAHNEPIGPRSSVAESTDAIQLAMLRSVGILNGIGDFVLHNGAGVSGQIDVAHNRPANLYEVPGIDAIMVAVRGVDKFIPIYGGEGTHYDRNNGPLIPDAFWPDGTDHGVNRMYLVDQGATFWANIAGIKSHVNLTASRRCNVDLYDVLIGKCQSIQFEAGQAISVGLSPSLDHAGYGAFIVRGTYN